MHPPTIRIVDAVLVLIKADTRTDAEIAALCGKSQAWMCLFKQRKIKSPSADTVQCLYENLSGRPLLGYIEEQTTNA